MPLTRHNQRLSVLLLMPLAEARGGAEMALEQLLDHGRGIGVAWHVAFFQDGPMVCRAKELGVDVTVIPTGRLRQSKRLLCSIRELAALARRVHADLILSWMGKAHLYGACAGAITSTPSVWFQHGLPSRRNLLDVLATCLPARGILACSRTVAEAQDRLWPRRPMRVVYPPVDLDRFDPSEPSSPLEVRRRLALPEAGPLIGMVGRLQWWKGFHVLIEAMPRILARHPDARCCLVGGEHALEPNYPRLLREQVQRLSLGDRVRMVGMQHNVPQWMQAMDVIVHASDVEPFGMVVVEAMALSKPVVAGGAGGPTEIITDGIDGLLSPYGDSVALADAVTRLLDDPEWARGLGRAARARSEAFCATRFASDLVAALGELAAQRPARRARVEAQSAAAFVGIDPIPAGRGGFR